MQLLRAADWSRQTLRDHVVWSAFEHQHCVYLPCPAVCMQAGNWVRSGASSRQLSAQALPSHDLYTALQKRMLQKRDAQCQT